MLVAMALEEFEAFKGVHLDLQQRLRQVVTSFEEDKATYEEADG